MKNLCAILIILLLTCCESEEKTWLKEGVILKLNSISSTITKWNDSLIYSRWDTTICIYSLKEKKVSFEYKTTDLCMSAPKIKDNKLFFPKSKNQFVCLDLNTKKIIWKLDKHYAYRNAEFVRDDLIVISVKLYGIICVNVHTGKVIWEYLNTDALVDLSPWPLSWDEKNIYVSNFNNGDELSCLSITDGKLKWRFKTKKSSYLGKSIVVGKDSLFVGTDYFYEGGEIFLLNTNNGEVYHRDTCNYLPHIDTIFDNGNIYFYCYGEVLREGGKLMRFNLRNKEMYVVKKFSYDSDIGFGNIHYTNNNIYFPSGDFDLNKYIISNNTFEKIGKTSTILLFAFSYEGNDYFVITK